jgi:hypothetical protein
LSDIRIAAKQKFVKIELGSALPADERNESGSYRDIWTEIPPNGRICPYTGLKHAKLYSLLGKGGLARAYVRVANLRDPGAKQGKTIFHVGDMLRFLDGISAQQGSGQLRRTSEEA